MAASKQKYSSPLWVQLLVTLIVIAMLLAYLAGEYIRMSETPHRLAHAQYMVQSKMKVVAATTLDAIIAQDIPVIETALKGVASLSKDIYRLEMRDARNNVLFSWRQPNFSEHSANSQLVNLSQPIKFEGEKLGTLLAGWDASATHAEIARQIDDVRQNILFFMLITAAILLAWMHRLVIVPIKQIKHRLSAGPSESEGLSSPWLAHEFHVLADSVRSLEEATTSKDNLESEIERRKDAEVELVRVRDEAMEANRAKSVFLANMSHELRTPLNAILGYSEILQEEARLNEHTDYGSDLEKIHVSGLHLLELINEVLDLSKIEAGKMELFLEAFVLSNIVDAVVKTVEPMMLKNGNTIRLEGLNAVPVMKADLTKVRQILYNLLSNAIKFTDHGEIVVSAKQQAVDGVDGIEIEVRDSGIGMSEEDIGNLFIPFQQVDVSTTRKYGGTGLGLALCRRLCDLMQGQIHVESVPGKGSSFYVWLPLEVKDGKNTVVDEVHTLRTGADPKNVRLPENVMRHVRSDERRKKISTVLTIDDDPSVLDLMARVYQREGFRPVSAHNGKVGVDLARKLRPDLITLDIMMPEMDGWEVLKTLKSDEELKDIPVIMVSIVENKPMALDVGAMDSLTKPIAWDRLLDLTRNAVRGKK
jgi:signal transduction histidine kinase